jgi:hypothetical protein
VPILYVVFIVVGLAIIYFLVRLYLYMRTKLAEAPLAGISRRRWAGAGREVAGGPSVARMAAPGSPAASAQAGGRGERPGKVALLGPAPAKPGARGHVPLLGPALSREGAQGPRVRPTVTSLRRAMPLQEMQQSSLPSLIEMRVDQQNHRIGFRNVHRIGSGAARSVGGRFSSFLIFLVPMPSRIAQIRNVEGRYVFTPNRSELFPGVGKVEDCLGKEIPFVNSKGRQMTLHFREWVSPLDEINRIMRQAKS